MAKLFRSLPGHCLVKQSKNRRLLRLEKERRKKKIARTAAEAMALLDDLVHNCKTPGRVAIEHRKNSCLNFGGSP